MDKDKAVWDSATTKILLLACIDQIRNNERSGTKFSAKAWNEIVSTFNEKASKQYEKKQLKNRLDVLRKDFMIWEKLINETGVGRDPGMNKVVASNEWWERKIQEHDEYKRFRHKSLMFEKEMRIIFKDVMATPENIFSPSSTQPLTQQDDVYSPCMDEEEEGSGDSEDDTFGGNPVPSTGVTDELGGIGLRRGTQSTGPTESGSRGKRKIGEGSGQRKREKKMPASRIIADAVSVMAYSSKVRAAAFSEENVDPAINELLQLEKVQKNEEFRNCCMTLLEDKTLREIFLATAKRNKQYAISWLSHKIKDT